MRHSRRSALCLATLVLLLAACGGEKGPAAPTVPTPTTISLLPLQALLTALTDTIRFSAVVKDQDGRGLVATVAFSSSDPGIVSVGPAGDATAIQNGTAQITATSGSARATATVTVAQEVATIQVGTGATQTGLVETELPETIRFSIVDALGTNIPQSQVTFDVPAGAGSISPSPATTDEFGNLEVTWTLGPEAGVHLVTVTAGEATTTIQANALGLPDLSVFSVVASPKNPTASQTVDLLVTLANGGLDANTSDVIVRITVDGVEVDSFESGPVPGNGTTLFFRSGLGPFAAGTRALQVFVDEADELLETNEANNSAQTDLVVVEATALESGVAVDALTGALGSQSFFTIEVAPDQGLTATALQVALTGGSGNADLFVRASSQPSTAEFDCSSVGGTSTETCLINDPEPGTYHVLVQGGAAFADVSLQGTVTEEVGPQGTFNIELVFLSGATDGQRAVFESARDRWEAAITADLANTDFGAQPFPANACTGGQREVVDVLDDLRIYVNLVPIDGPSGTLGSAGPCALRDGSQLPLLGSMRFDTADLEALESSGRFVSVILHEMGHVLGIGTIWNRFDLLVDPSLPSSQGADTHFPGTNAIAAFDEAGGDSYTGGMKVPVENQAGRGSGDSHWRESVLDTELMTPFLENGANPMSAITIASLADLGYSVTTTVADEYSRPGTSGVAGTTDDGLDLGNDVRRGPIFVVDKTGRVVRVIR